MKFRNESGEERVFPALGLVVADGEEFELAEEQAAGLVLQCGEGGLYAPADEQAKAAVEEAFAALEPAEEVEPPPKSANHAAWIAYAQAQGDTAAADKTKKELVAEYGQEG